MNTVFKPGHLQLLLLTSTIIKDVNGFIWSLVFIYLGFMDRISPESIPYSVQLKERFKEIIARQVEQKEGKILMSCY